MVSFERQLELACAAKRYGPGVQFKSPENGGYYTVMLSRSENYWHGDAENKENILASTGSIEGQYIFYNGKWAEILTENKTDRKLLNMEHKASNTQIYFTTDYGRFLFLKGNRDINVTKVNKIISDIENGIDILKYSPIIVNSKMEIIDGQHRYAVSRKLKTNVYYVIMSDADLSTVPAINSKGSKWKSRDFLNSYIDLKKPAYKDLEKFLNTYPKISLAVAIPLLHFGSASSDVAATEAFCTGVFETKYRDKAHKFSTLLHDFTPFMENPYSRRMFNVVMRILDNGKYDHSLMLKKLKESGRKISNVDSEKSIIEDMESIINHKSRSRIYIV